MDNPTSESLAAIVVTNRVLGLYLEESKHCMSELLRRREEDGDTFPFEKFIEEKIKEMEDINKESRNNSGLLSLVSAMSSVRNYI